MFNGFIFALAVLSGTFAPLLPSKRPKILVNHSECSLFIDNKFPPKNKEFEYFVPKNHMIHDIKHHINTNRGK